MVGIRDLVVSYFYFLGIRLLCVFGGQLVIDFILLGKLEIRVKEMLKACVSFCKGYFFKVVI